jgi:hypothetical protein
MSRSSVREDFVKIGYSLGINGLYLNLKDREQRGIVEPGEQSKDNSDRIWTDNSVLNGRQKLFCSIGIKICNSWLRELD